MHLTGVLFGSIGRALEKAADTGHLTAGDVVGVISQAAAEGLAQSTYQDKDLVHFHPEQPHPQHPNPDLRG